MCSQTGGAAMKPWTIVLLLLLPLGLFGCSAMHYGAEAPISEMSQSTKGEIVPGEPLLTMADSREEAEALAQQYGIELVAYESGVATFFTEEDPNAVIQRGIQNGWPELSLNRKTGLS